MLDHLLADAGVTQSIVFIATKRDAESLAARLRGEGHAAAALHGDMNQRERTRTLADMRRGHVRTLVATDVAARGIDVAGISHVINFDLPRQAGDYVHRIGRTGRAGATGTAVSLAGHAERGQVRQIERFTGSSITAHVIAGLEPRSRPAGNRNERSAGARAPRVSRRAPWRGGAKSLSPTRPDEPRRGTRNREPLALNASALLRMGTRFAYSGATFAARFCAARNKCIVVSAGFHGATTPKSGGEADVRADGRHWSQLPARGEVARGAGSMARVCKEESFHQRQASTPRCSFVRAPAEQLSIVKTTLMAYPHRR